MTSTSTIWNAICSYLEFKMEIIIVHIDSTFRKHPLCSVPVCQRTKILGTDSEEVIKLSDDIAEPCQI